MSSTSSESGQSSAEKPRSGFAFSKASWSSGQGPETVVNPGQREKSSSVHLEGMTTFPDSQIVHRLFPPEFPAEEGIPLDEPNGVQLGHFVIESRIGTGGMGSVFLANDTRLDRTIALKILAPGQARDPSSVQRFRNEAQAAARLDHENIARVFYYGEDRGLHFIAYEFITGTNVRDCIRLKGKIDPGEAVNYTLQIASALNHTSSVGVVHRDIKPSNIIITPSGRAKLVDLGLARKQSQDDSDELTTAGTTLGTFDYIAPEQAKDPRNVDVRSDIYSLGCTLYHMLIGEPPYPEGTVLQKLLDHQGADPPDPCKKNRRVPQALGTVVQKMMASDPRKRYATPDDLIRDLMPFVGKMVLRDLGSAGLVWASSDPKGSRFWEKNLGWMVTAAVLLLIVFLINRYPTGVPGIKGTDLSGFALSSNSSGQREEPNNLANFAEENEAAKSGKEKVFSPARPEKNSLTNAGGKNAAERESLGPFPIGNVLGDPALQPLSKDLFKDLPKTTGPNGKSSKSAPAEVAVILPPVEAVKPVEPIVEKPQPAVSIVTSNGEIKSYLTLEAACSETRDGDVIELNYNGRLLVSAKKPLKVTNKEITIRAGKDRNGNRYRPLIEFVSDSGSEAEDVHMLALIDGNVKFINVDLRMKMGSGYDMGTGGRMNFFESHGSDTVRLENVGLTVVNPHPDKRQAAVFALAPQSASSRNNKMMMNSDQVEDRGFHFEIVGSFVRGGCDLFSSRFARPGRIKIENSVVAVERALLNLIGDEENSPPENAALEVQLDHVTCLVGNGLLKVHSGNDDLSGSLIPVVFAARNNIFATRTGNSLVSMTGRTGLQDFQRILRRWEGSRNFYGPFDFFWLIKRDTTAEPDYALDLRGWKKLWGRTDTDFDPFDFAVVWDQKELWKKKPFSQLTREDVELDPDPEINPAALNADDGSDAGADLSRFSDFPREESAVAEK